MALPDKPLRIVHVLRAPMGGVLRHVRDLTAQQAAQGHEVGLICDLSGTAGYNEAMLEAMEATLSLGLHRIAISRSVGPADISAVRKAIALLKGMAPDVVHGHGAKGGVLARVAGTLSGLRPRPVRFYSPHGGSLHYDPASMNGRLYFTIERMLERMTDGILFVADYEKRTYAAKIGEPTCRSHVVYNGLTQEEFGPVAPAPDAADFLFIGEMRMLKGPDFFVEGIRRITAEGRDVSAIMVGDGPDRATVEDLIAGSGLTGVISMRPPMPARQAFGLARIVVMPSRAEAMPYIVLEALAAGCALIATNVGGISEIYGDKAPVLVAPEEDDVAAAMAGALADPARLRAAMPAPDILAGRFAVSSMALQVTGTYADSLARRGRSNVS